MSPKMLGSRGRIVKRTLERKVNPYNRELVEVPDSMVPGFHQVQWRPNGNRRFSTAMRVIFLPRLLETLPLFKSMFSNISYFTFPCTFLKISFNLNRISFMLVIHFKNIIKNLTCTNIKSTIQIVLKTILLF